MTDTGNNPTFHPGRRLTTDDIPAGDTDTPNPDEERAIGRARRETRNAEKSAVPDEHQQRFNATAGQDTRGIPKTAALASTLGGIIALPAVTFLGFIIQGGFYLEHSWITLVILAATALIIGVGVTFWAGRGRMAPIGIAAVTLLVTMLVYAGLLYAVNLIGAV